MQMPPSSFRGELWLAERGRDHTAVRGGGCGGAVGLEPAGSVFQFPLPPRSGGVPARRWEGSGGGRGRGRGFPQSVPDGPGRGDPAPGASVAPGPPLAEAGGGALRWPWWERAPVPRRPAGLQRPAAAPSPSPPCLRWCWQPSGRPPRLPAPWGLSRAALLEPCAAGRASPAARGLERRGEGAWMGLPPCLFPSSGGELQPEARSVSFQLVVQELEVWWK